MTRFLFPAFALFILLAMTGCGEKRKVSAIESHAANEDVARYMENFEGRGELTDSNSRPTPPVEAVKRFRHPADLAIELVVSEPQITQPVDVSFDYRGRLWVVQYHQYPYPEGLKVTAIDNHTRVQFDHVPKAPPAGIKGADKITFFEDTDGDGTYDKGTDAVTGLNIATSVALGRGKIWVLNPPYLLAYADSDGDGLPEGDPVVHLKGFGLEDTHAVANSLTWGPDGWLYGAQGSTVTSTVSSRVTDAVAFAGQAIWRYNPETEVFELFAEGGGNNPFNVEIDSQGRLFSGSNGNGRGPYYKQGAYYVKSWGKHGPLTNPYAFGYLPNMPLDGEKIRFTHAFIKYEGGALPEKYHHKMFALNPLHNYIQLTAFEPFGSSFKNVDEDIVLNTDDKWFRPVAIKVGPDGALYIADWYDSRLSHVDPHDTWDKGSGRIYRLSSADRRAPLAPFDLKKYSLAQLVDLLSHENKWFWQQALLQFGDRKDPAAIPLLLPLLDSKDPQLALEALWALNLSGGFTDALAKKTLAHTDPFVRMWAVRLLGDKRVISHDVSRALIRLSSKEDNAEVRSQLACTAKRLSAADALPIIGNLLKHQEDMDDPDIPLLIWWAVESKAISDRDAVVTWLEDRQLWRYPLVKKYILHRLMQRYTMEGGDKNFAACERLLKLAPSREEAMSLVEGLEEGLMGREMVALPAGLLKALAPYRDNIGDAPLTLALRQGNQEALKTALAIISDEHAEMGTRLAYVRLMGEVNQPACVPVLLNLVKRDGVSSAVKQDALYALQSYGSDEIGQELAKAYPAFRGDSYAREAAQALFACRPSWALDFLREIDETKVIHRTDVPDYMVKRFALLHDERVNNRVAKLWPDVRLLTTVEKTERIKKYTAASSTGQGDPAKGRMLFLNKCGACHRLFGEGGTLGPELTGYERSNVPYLLLQVVDPNADIREGYEVQRLVTSDGRTLEGRIKQQSGGGVTLQPPLGGRSITLSKDKIASMEVQDVSLMPERILDPLSDQEIRDLLAYLMGNGRQTVGND